MLAIHLNHEEQSQIREYFMKTITLKEKQEEYDIFLDSVCPSLKFKAMMHLFSVCLLKNLQVQKYLKDTSNQSLDNEKNMESITENQFLKYFSSKLGVCFLTPEESIIKQGNEGLEIYYIMQGDCTVDITEFNGNVIKAMGLLVEGDHFGEISFFYKCPITCTITSRNYNSMARL
jgi:CRP-like cAMP-binding protein